MIAAVVKIQSATAATSRADTDVLALIVAMETLLLSGPTTLRTISGPLPPVLPPPFHRRSITQMKVPEKKSAAHSSPFWCERAFFVFVQNSYL